MKRLDPYKILQVTRKSKPEEIITSFKKLRYKYHPDRPKGNRELYDQVIEAFESIKNNSHEYMNVNEFIERYKGSDEEYNDIIKAYEKYKGDMRKIMDSLICTNEEDEEKIRDILTEEIKAGKIKKYENESKKAEELAKKMGIDLSLSLEDLLNRQDSRQETLIKRLESKYGDVKRLKK